MIHDAISFHSVRVPIDERIHVVLSLSPYAISLYLSRTDHHSIHTDLTSDVTLSVFSGMI
jgi:hypothetical protein